MKNWTIKDRIILGFTLVILINVALGIFTCSTLSKLRLNANDIAENQVPGILGMANMRFTASNLSRKVLFETTSTTAQEAQASDTATDEAEKALDKVISDYKDNGLVSPKETELYTAVLATRDTYYEAVKAIRTLSLNLQTKEAQEMIREKSSPLYLKFLAAVQAEMDFNKTDLKTAAKESNDLASFTFTATIAGLLLAVALGIASAVAIIRTTNRALTRISDILGESSAQVASASGQLSASSQSLAEGASEQAAALEETSASLEEMASLGKQNNANAASAKDRTKSTLATVENGVSEMEQMGSVLTKVKGASDELTTSTNAIKHASNNIAKIIKTIDEIAFQTNILALNAAVEAARAGEAGAGFAVVAEEVRSLAQRSANAAKETAAMIEDSISKSNQGVEITGKVVDYLNALSENAGKVGERLAEIQKQIKEVDQFSNEIADASQEQSHGIGQVNIAVGNMDKVTQTTAATAEEAAAASEELTAQAEGLKEATHDLIRLVKGTVPDSTARVATKTLKPIQPIQHVPITTSRIPNGNGHGSHPIPKLAHISAKRQGKNGGIPLPGDFTPEPEA